MDTEKKSSGAIVGLVVIIIILIIGGIYIWKSSKSNTPAYTNTIGQSSAVTSQDATALDALGQDAQKTDVSTGVDASTVN